MSDETGGQRGTGPLGPLLEPGARVAGFVIEGPLASGGGGFVYRARRDGRLFALKLLRMTSRDDREMDALRRVHHPNVVEFQGCGFWPDEAPRFQVLALEYVRGRPLEVWADEENPSALELVHQFLLPFTLTLAQVHDSGVVHRDVKESNILIRDGDRQPVLVDFGAACYEGARRLTPRLPPGTPEYRSPDVLRSARDWTGEPLPMSPSDDLWALGVTLYWLLTRTMPFGDRNGPLTRAILHQEPLAPQLLNPRVPHSLGEVCTRLLAKNPKERYADARALSRALTEEFSRADRSWREPLFPPTPRLPPAPVVRRWRTAMPWVAGVGLFLALFLFIPRDESPVSSPPRQAISSQEVAPARMTGEVARGAEPRTSTLPAPVAPATPRKDNEMMTPKKTRSVARAALLVGATCMGPGCASVPLRQGPPPAECPPGSEATNRRIGLAHHSSNPIYFKGFDPASFEPIPVEEGPVAFLTIADWGELPDRTLLSGELFFGKDRVYGRITRVHLKSGEVLPVCMDVFSGDAPRGFVMEEGSTSRKALIINTPFAAVVSRFE